MKRRAVKTETTDVQSGVSGEDVLPLQIVEEVTPANPAAQEVIRELAAAKTPLEMMEERVGLLEQKGKISCLYSCSICPQSFIERMEELEESSNGFCPSHAMSVTDARQVQIALTESIKLSMGHESYLIYKVNILNQLITRI